MEQIQSVSAITEGNDGVDRRSFNDQIRAEASRLLSYPDGRQCLEELGLIVNENVTNNNILDTVVSALIAITHKKQQGSIRAKIQSAIASRKRKR